MNDLAYRILAHLYPDRRPSEIRKIIEESKEANEDDIEMWKTMLKEKDCVKEYVIAHRSVSEVSNITPIDAALKL